MSQVIYQKDVFRLIVGAVLASTLSVALAACGGGSLQGPNGGNFPQGPGFDYGDVLDQLPTAEFPSISHDFRITGESGSTPSFTTSTIQGADSTLRVRVLPGPAERLTMSGGPAGFSASYACITYRVSLILNGVTVETRTTRRLATGGSAVYPHWPYATQNYNPCSGAVENDTLDFSNRLYPGHPPARIRVHSARTDFRCSYYFQLYMTNPRSPGGYGSLALSFSNHCSAPYPVENVHLVSGTLEIQVDGSNL